VLIFILALRVIQLLFLCFVSPSIHLCICLFSSPRSSFFVSHNPCKYHHASTSTSSLMIRSIVFMMTASFLCMFYMQNFFSDSSTIFIYSAERCFINECWIHLHFSWWLHDTKRRLCAIVCGVSIIISFVLLECVFLCCVKPVCVCALLLTLVDSITLSSHACVYDDVRLDVLYFLITCSLCLFVCVCVCVSVCGGLMCVHV